MTELEQQYRDLEKALEWYLQHKFAAPLLKASLPAGQRWVTIKEGHLRGRHILIDSKGYVVGGAIPKAFHGHHIGKLKGVGTDENTFDNYEHHELKAVHKDFTAANEANKAELHSLVHDTAKYLLEMHQLKHDGKSDVVKWIRQMGGIRPPVRGKHAFADEYHESVPRGVRQSVGHKDGRPLDEVADELHMSARELIDRLSDAETAHHLRPEDFYDEAEETIDRMQGHGEVQSRRDSIEQMEQMIAKVHAAMKRKEHEKAQSKHDAEQKRKTTPGRLAASFIAIGGRLLAKKDVKRVVRYHVTAAADKIMRQGFRPDKPGGVGGEGNRTAETYTSEDPAYSYRLRDHFNALEAIRTSADPMGAAHAYVGDDAYSFAHGNIGNYEDMEHRELSPAEAAMVIAVPGAGAFPELDPTSFFVDGPKRTFEVIGVDVTNGFKRGESPDFGHEESWNSDTIRPFRLAKSESEDRGYYPSARNAYKTNHKDPIYIPVNRIETPYQTDLATNPDKVAENVQKMRDGVALAPVVIGYDYDLHDGHHRLEAAKKVGYTHVPCVVSGRNERRTNAADKRYRQVWKSEMVASGGRLLVKKLAGHLQRLVDEGNAHWVTIKEGPLQGRHILLSGPRGASTGQVLAGKGVPRHIMDGWNTANGHSSSQGAQAQRETPPTGTKDRVSWWQQKYNKGNFTADEAREHFAWATSHKQDLHDMYMNIMNEHPDYKRKRKATKEDIANKSVNKHIEKLAYAASNSFSYNPFGGDDAKEQAIKNVLDRLTDQDIANHWSKINAEREAHNKALTNPETLQELREKKRVLGADRLTDAERERLDELEALDAKQRQAPPETKKVAQTTADVGGFDVSKTKHTKTGADMWVAKPKNRVSKEEYQELNNKMKALGGYYSRFVHGFVFNEDPGDKLNGLLDGGAEVQNPKASEEYQENRQKAVADKLRGVADNMQSAIDAKRADRLTNTARRASMAASAEADADRMQHIQGVMRRIADAIESGEATHLDGVTSRTQIETLESILSRQKWENDQKAGVRYEQSRERKVNMDDIKHVEYPKPGANVTGLEWLIRDLNGAPGTKRAAQYLQRYIDEAKSKGKYYFDFDHGSRAFEEIQKLVNIGKTNPKAKSSAENVNDSLMTSKRLQAMGIQSSEQLRAALREYMQYRGKGGISDEEKARRELRDKEQEVTRQNIAGFFPTPKPIAHEMVEMADIKPGMKVLEPSAGKGNIADAIKEHAPGADLDVVEYNHSLGDILQRKGHNVVGNDFLEHKGEYDRIVMNPPFENGQDIDHVRHAYEMLKPGGRIVAIMSEGPFGRSDRKSQEFRDWMDTHGGTSEQMPEGSFKDSERSTGVRTRMVVIDKPKNTGDVSHRTYKHAMTVVNGRLLVKRG